MRSLVIEIAIAALSGSFLLWILAARRGYKHGRNDGFKEGQAAGRYQECKWWYEVDCDAQLAAREGKRVE